MKKVFLTKTVIVLVLSWIVFFLLLLFLGYSDWRIRLIFAIVFPLNLGLIYIYAVFCRYTNMMHIQSYENGECAAQEWSIPKNNNQETIIFHCVYQDGKWQLSIGNALFLFSLKEYIFPRSFICAFAIRQVMYKEFANKKDVRLSVFFRNIQSEYLKRRRVSRIVIFFDENGKKKEILIAQKARIRYTPLSSIINQSVLGASPRPLQLSKKFYMMNEDDFYRLAKNP